LFASPAKKSNAATERDPVEPFDNDPQGRLARALTDVLALG
jgi:hypothetical protein